jgi:protein-L-isoaspartate(D-aspartate) O-methyltransferase
MNFEQARYNMIEQQLRPWKVLDPDVLDVLHVVKREEFVPAAHRRLAFADTEIVLGNGTARCSPPRLRPCPAGAGDEEARKRA